MSSRKPVPGQQIGQDKSPLLSEPGTVGWAAKVFSETFAFLSLVNCGPDRLLNFYGQDTDNAFCRTVEKNFSASTVIFRALQACMIYTEQTRVRHKTTTTYDTGSIFCETPLLSFSFYMFCWPRPATLHRMDLRHWYRYRERRASIHVGKKFYYSYSAKHDPILQPG